MRQYLPKVFPTLLLLAWPVACLFAQSQSSSQQTPPPQQPSSQSPQQAKTPPKTDDSVADAAKKTDKDKRKPKKVYTEDDLSGIGKGGVSVVGDDNKKATRPTSKDGNYDPKGEEYWRSRSQPLLDQIAAADQQIEQLREDIKKYGNGGFDVQTGMKDSVAYIHDRGAQIENLQKRKAALQKQLEDLEEEGRKAGAQPAWFR